MTVFMDVFFLHMGEGGYGIVIKYCIGFVNKIQQWKTQLLQQNHI